MLNSSVPVSRSVCDAFCCSSGVLLVAWTAGIACSTGSTLSLRAAGEVEVEVGMELVMIGCSDTVARSGSVPVEV